MKKEDETLGAPKVTSKPKARVREFPGSEKKKKSFSAAHNPPKNVSWAGTERDQDFK